MLSFHPSDAKLAPIYSNRSACYASVGKLNAAIEDAEKCIEIKPEWGKGHSRLGVALVRPRPRALRRGGGFRGR